MKPVRLLSVVLILVSMVGVSLLTNLRPALAQTQPSNPKPTRRCACQSFRYLLATACSPVRHNA